MVDTTPDDSSGPPVERLARSLLACARDQPSLLVRSRAAADGALPGLIEALPQLHVRRAGWLPGPLGGPADRSPYLEELVSISIATARQAEDAARHASAACAMARRGRFVWAGFGVLGIVIGISGVVDAHWIQGMSHLQVKMADVAHLPAEPPGKADNMPGSVIEAETPVAPALHGHRRAVTGERHRCNRRGSPTRGDSDRGAFDLVDRSGRRAAPRRCTVLPSGAAA